MDYIINPMWFYWLGLADIAKNICIALFIVSLTTTVIFSCMAIQKQNDAEEYKDSGSKYSITCRYSYGIFKKAAITSGIVCFLSMTGAIFIPTKETLIYIMVARQATYTNIGLTVDAIKEAVDYVVQAISNIR